MADEAAPTLGELPGIDLEGYMATLIERFSNPRMRDTLVRLATDGSNRMPTFTLPAIRENLEAGRPIRLGAGDGRGLGGVLGADRRAARSCPPRCPDDVHAAEMTAAAADPRPGGVRRDRGAVR